MNPLKRKEADAQLGLSFDEDNEKEYREQRQAFMQANNKKLLWIYEKEDLPMIPVLYKMEK